MADIFVSSGTRSRYSVIPTEAIEIQTLYRQQVLATPGPDHPETFSFNASSSFYSSLALPKAGKAIRLLELDSAKDIDEPLIGNLRVVDLTHDDCPEFFALSYHWGTCDGDTPVIQCGGQALEVTPNCYRALQRLRQKRKEMITIWIDAICIDQKNDAEKEHQIPLMGDIYTRAAVTFAWLGDDDESSRGAMQHISRAARFNYLPFRPRLSPPTWIEKTVFALGLLLTYTIFYPLYRISWNIVLYLKRYKPKGEHLSELLEREWFFRAWTFQESVLPLDLVLVCGTDHLPWDTFLRGALFLNDTSRSKHPGWMSPILRLFRLKDHFHMDMGSHLRPDFVPLTFNHSRMLFHLRMAVGRRTVGAGAQQYHSIDEYQAPYNKIHDTIIPRRRAKRNVVAFIICGLQCFAYILIFIILGSRGGGGLSTLGIVFLMGFWAFLTSACVFLVVMLRPINRNVDGTTKVSKDSGENSVVEAIVHFLRERRATDPRDLAYALHGILTQMAIPSLTKADLTRGPGQTYSTLFSDLLRWKPVFIIMLLDAGRHEEGHIEGAPSWVPDWNELPGLSPEPMRDLFLRSRRMRDRIDVTPGLQPFAEICDDGTVMTVHGIIHSDLAFGTEYFSSIVEEDLTGGPLDPESLAFQAVLQFASWIGSVRILAAGSGDHLANTIALAVSGSYHDFGEHVRLQQSELHGTKQQAVSMTRFLNKNKCMCDIFMDMVTMGLEEDGLVREVNTVLEKLAQQADALKHFVVIVNYFAWNRLRLIVTVAGELGHATKGATAGDRLAVVGGVPAPLILRPQNPDAEDRYGTKYDVIGHAHVNGYMDGSSFNASLAREILLI